MRRRTARAWKIAMLTVLCTICMIATASAAKVSKVTCDVKYNNSYQYAVIRGKTSGGKTVWTYKSAKYTATELAAVAMKTKGSYVYVLEGRKYVRLGKQSGRVLVKKNVLPSGYGWGSPAMVVSSTGNLYAMGYYDDTVYRISKNGTVDWKRSIKDPYYWPYKMKLSSGTLTIYFDPPYGKCSVTLSASTGKIKKYTKGS